MVRIINPQLSGARSGATFGATLYRIFVLSCATRFAVENKSISFILWFLFGMVQYGAGKCFIAQIRT